MGIRAKQKCVTCSEAGIIRYKWANFSDEKMKKPKACPEKDHALVWSAIDWDGQIIIPDNENRESFMSIAQQVENLSEDWQHSDGNYYNLAFQFIMESDNPVNRLDRFENTDFNEYQDKEEFARKFISDEYNINDWDAVFDFINLDDLADHLLEDNDNLEVNDTIYTWD